MLLIIMIKGHERILQLHSPLSKLLDSLCFEMTVNKVDQNCISLLEILLWKQNNDIDDDQLAQLYRSWLESKSIFDLFTCKQIEAYPKHQLIFNELVQNSFLDVQQITKNLEIVNELYNKIYLEKRPKSIESLEKIERIFSYLDAEGHIHLRLSDLFFFTGACLIVENYSIPLNYESFRVFMDNTRKELCEINGIASLRAFKNYFLKFNQAKRNTLLDGIVPVFKELQRNTGQLPNILDQAFSKWKNFPRFTNNPHQGKKRLQIYKRVFQENQIIFFDDGASIEYFVEKYGEEFVECFEIDNHLLRQFNLLMKDIIKRYIELFMSVNSLMKPSKKQSQRAKDKTPIKTARKPAFKSRTPQKLNENYIRRQFESEERSQTKTYQGRQTTPTKSHKPNYLSHSYAYSNQKVAPKAGIEKNSLYNKMSFFKNKRIESYEVVMKRLRGK